MAATPHGNATEDEEPWVADVKRKYSEYDPVKYGLKMKKRSIYKWPNDLVVASGCLSQHRTPCLISFGPYHCGKDNLQQMEYHKERALYRILDRSKVRLSNFIDSLKEIEQELRDSYDNLSPQLSSHSFLQMMLFDGCCLLELLRADLETDHDSSSRYEPLFRSGASTMVTVIKRDMLMLENQIPLLVLNKLLEVEESGEVNRDSYLFSLVSNFFGFGFPIENFLIHGPSLHILDLYRKCLIMERTDSISSCCQLPLHLAIRGLKHLLIAIPVWVFWLLHGGIPKHGHTRSATRLHAAGIEFKKGKHNAGLKIYFNGRNGVLTLPYIEVNGFMAITFMNLMAFERMHLELNEKDDVTKYVTVMDDLIDTAEDVSLLSSQGILRNYLGSDEDAAKLFNTLSDGQILSSKHGVVPLQKQLQEYVSSDWNMAIAHLKRNYFKNPWSVISLLAAVIFLVLTIIQTVFSGLSLKNGNG